MELAKQKNNHQFLNVEVGPTTGFETLRQGTFKVVISEASNTDTFQAIEDLKAWSNSWIVDGFFTNPAEKYALHSQMFKLDHESQNK